MAPESGRQSPVEIRPVGDRALLAAFENRIDPVVSNQVLNLKWALEQQSHDGIEEIVCSYRTLLIYYDPLSLTFNVLSDLVHNLLRENIGPAAPQRRWRIPVCYGGAAAPDLENLAQAHGLTAEEVIDIHGATLYRVYLVGFSPGWTFLGGLDERLHTPRLATPRAEVPAGCISIGGQQGMIGGLAMPSGWNLIGQTPERTYAPERKAPFFMAAGDEVEIRQIDKTEYAHLASKAAQGLRVSEALHDTE